MGINLSRILQSGLALALTVSAGTSHAFGDEKLEQAVDSAHRTPAYKARDGFRHPAQTLAFFGLKSGMTVVEISPGGGWYTEILAHYLKDNGTYIAAGYDPQSKSEYYRKSAQRYQKKLDANPDVYGQVKLAVMQPPEQVNIAKANTADLVVSFRNTHNWHRRGNAEVVYGAVFKALKPGGIFGVVQHRAGTEHPTDTSGKMGYLKQEDVIALAKKAGFELVATSEINANPKDMKNYEKGVWTLPPSYRLGDKDKAKYQAIGESDRMTLKFKKPE